MMADIQGSPPPASQTGHPNKGEIGKIRQEASKDEQLAAEQAQIENEAFRKWKQGQLA